MKVVLQLFRDAPGTTMACFTAWAAASTSGVLRRLMLPTQMDADCTTVSRMCVGTTTVRLTVFRLGVLRTIDKLSIPLFKSYAFGGRKKMDK